MPNVDIYIETEDELGDTAALQEAWVYWSAGGAITLLRTDKNGQAFQLDAGGDRTRPWVYTTTNFQAAVNAEIDIYYSRGTKPIPDPILSGMTPPAGGWHPPMKAPIFFHTTVLERPPDDPPPVLLGPNNVNVLAMPATGIVRVPKFVVTLQQPEELKLWPILWELPSQEDPADLRKPYFQTGNIRQRAQWWNNPAQENAASSIAPIAVAYQGHNIPIRPRERGLLIKGQIDARAATAKIQFLDAAGAVIPLRQKFESDSPEQDHTDCKLGPAQNGLKSYEATVFFRHSVAGTIRVPESAQHFGPAFILVLAEQMTPQIVEAFAGHFCGMQAALVDDFPKAANGQTRGDLMGEAAEIAIVDFRHSPVAHAPAPPASSLISDETRARRMVEYKIAYQPRLLDAAQAAGPDNPNVTTPQMPLWMGEAQIVGIDKDQLKDLQLRRYKFKNPDPKNQPAAMSIDIAVQWQVNLKWAGPDNNTGVFGPNSGNPIQRPNQHYSYEYSPAAEVQNVKLQFNANGELSDDKGAPVKLDADGSLPNAFAAAPVAPAFPVPNRRLTKVIVDSLNRPWGRHQNAVQKPSIVIEWQPLIEDGGNEIIRGGDGVLSVVSASLDQQRPQTWTAPPLPPASPEPEMRTPLFRITSRDRISLADGQALIDALVQKYFNAHSGDDQVAPLSLLCWQITARKIFDHENRGPRQYYRQFEERKAQREKFDRNVPNAVPPIHSHFYFGLESGMPLFGAPHGYGFGQLDDPQADDRQVWSVVENVREAVRRIFEKYARNAWDHLTTAVGHKHFTDLANGTAQDQWRQRAIYQRELVRRYNGGIEFRYENMANQHQWVVHTTSNLTTYTDDVLGTAVGGGPTAFDQVNQFTAETQ